MYDPTQLAGLKMENSPCMLVSRNTVHVTSCVSSQELGTFDPLYF